MHTFSTEAGSPFAQTAAEGLQHAGAARELGIVALQELDFRRTGLAASLVVILLIGFGLKIRELSRRRAGGG